ncbi:hypothetical protein GCM10007874_10230 [Labrys miyagiensis]|uniref:Uncharacterized protein n=1 Tax=Labrys miyagiensis TaxID=346912 RepID=A0ABQ6CEC1_9HYPH|nr:hypothetical protein GCM10007874_10230 [Labrys miyagiensis]
MQAALSVQAAIAPFRLPGALTRRARPPVFPPIEGRRRAGSGRHGPSEPDQPARSRGSALQSWPDSGMNRLHRIGGRWDEGAAGLKPFTLRPGIIGHFHGVPIPSVPLVTLAAGFERSRTAAHLSLG